MKADPNSTRIFRCTQSAYLSVYKLCFFGRKGSFVAFLILSYYFSGWCYCGAYVGWVFSARSLHIDLVWFECRRGIRGSQLSTSPQSTPSDFHKLSCPLSNVNAPARFWVLGQWVICSQILFLLNFPKLLS